MVLCINGEYIPIDVKQMHWHEGHQIWKSFGTPTEGVYFVLVHPVTGEIRWPWKVGQARSKKPKCPPGLENFWS
ncbi:MAG: hypothetical protein CMQ57_03535 [Gammaproteobacteria bacterium]|nr:hypothetical protein [Gammaproteobacteria bacterium]|tara:strand:+ start:500 stop:721 length:222 start_codon:yes stop_codon:yes gene_type:complete